MLKPATKVASAKNLTLIRKNISFHNPDDKFGE
jgi:hypothetical protein